MPTAQNRQPFHATIVYGGAEARRQRGLTLAQTLVCSDPAHAPCGVCRDCRKAMEGIHPDIIRVEQFMEEKDFGGEIKIAPIRALRSDAFIRPNEARHKVYLIDNAQNMNPNAQNALLKLLEEGPAYAAFLLLTDSAGSLLETIRSRCALENAGEDAAGNAALNEDALSLARLIASGTEEERQGFLARLECSKPDKQELDGFLTGLATLLQDAALGSVTGSFETKTPEASLLAQSRSTAALLRLADRVAQARDMTAFHVGSGHLLGWLGVAMLEELS